MSSSRAAVRPAKWWARQVLSTSGCTEMHSKHLGFYSVTSCEQQNMLLSSEEGNFWPKCHVLPNGMSRTDVKEAKWLAWWRVCTASYTERHSKEVRKQFVMSCEWWNMLMSSNYWAILAKLKILSREWWARCKEWRQIEACDSGFQMSSGSSLCNYY